MIPDTSDATGQVQPLRRTVGAQASTDVRGEAWLREMERAQSHDWLGHHALQAGGVNLLARRAGRDTPGPVDRRGEPSGGERSMSGSLASSKGTAGEPTPAAAVARTIRFALRGLMTSAVGQAVASPSHPFVADVVAPGAPRPAGESGSPGEKSGRGSGDLVTRGTDLPTSGAFPFFPGPTPAAPARFAAPEGARAARSERTPSAPAAGEREAVRIHAEWTAQGVKVWLGLSASTAAHAEQVAQAIQQWLNTQGQRLISVTCNGRVLTPSAWTGPTRESSQEQTACRSMR